MAVAKSANSEVGLLETLVLVTLGKLLNFSVPLSPTSKRGDQTYLVGLW